MKIFNSISEFSNSRKTVATLGTFDGVHKGHRKIIDRLVQSASDENAESVILTFFPHPRTVVQQDSDIKMLNTMSEKALLLQQAGLQNLVIHPFDKAFSRLTAEEFVRDILVEKLNISKIIIGYDHRFGRNRTANIDDLVEFGEQFGFDVEQISAEEVNAVSVSSTKVREAILSGNMALANDFLGYDYFFTATVVHGKKLGRTIGYPTANLKIAEDYKLIPKQGVYVVRSVIGDRPVFGMMNIGTNPTVEDGKTLSLEVHFFDVNEDLYEKELVISVLHRLRDEEKYPSLDILIEQLGKDQNDSLAFLKLLK